MCNNLISHYSNSRTIAVVSLFLSFVFLVNDRTVVYGLYYNPGVVTTSTRTNDVVLLFREKQQQKHKTFLDIPRGGEALATTTPASSLPSLSSLSLAEDFGSLIGYREGLLVVAIYYLVGVIAYHFIFEKWSIVDALYFSCVCCSTVGYGDLCPTTKAGKLFACVYGFAGISIIGIGIAAIGAKLHKLEYHALCALHLDSQKSLLDFYETSYHSSKRKKKKKSDNDDDEDLSSGKENHVSLPILFLLIIVSNIVSLISMIMRPFIIILLGGILFGRLEGWPLLDSMYFSIISASTIGFGDLSPTTEKSRLIAALIFIPFVVTCAGTLISNIGTMIVHRRQKRKFHRIIMNHIDTLSMDDFQILDTNKDGKVTREEYVLFMLQEIGLVTPEEIQELKSQFHRLDVTDSGFLDQQDLETFAQVRRQEHKEEIMLLASTATTATTTTPLSSNGPLSRKLRGALSRRQQQLQRRAANKSKTASSTSK